MRRYLLLGMFIGLMADGMFGWGLGIAPGVSLKNALLYILVLIMAIEFALTGRKATIDLPFIHVLFLLLFFLGFLSWAANTFIGMYVEYAPLSGAISLKGTLLDHYLFFLVFFAGVRSEADVLWLQKWILIAIALGNIVTVLDAYNLLNLDVIETRGDDRVQGPLGEANQYGLFVALFLPILLARAWIETGAMRIFFAIGSGATFLVLLLTVSRGAMLSLVVGSIFAVVFLRQHMNARYVRRVAALGALAVAAAAVVLGQQYGSLIVERLSVVSSGTDSFAMTSGRTWIWSTALATMMNEPASILTGYGWNTFRGLFRIAPHNVYLHRFFELGICGLMLFVALMCSILARTKQVLDKKTMDGSLVPGQVALVFAVSILMVGIFAVDLTNPWYFVWSYIGLMLRGGMIVLEVQAPKPATAIIQSEKNPTANQIQGGQHAKANVRSPLT